jgi:hypothetical protein
MSSLERLFALEIEVHRKLRCEAPHTPDTSALHTSSALQNGDEPLLKSTGRVTVEGITQIADRLTLSGDARDVLAARDSLTALLGLQPFDP